MRLAAIDIGSNSVHMIAAETRPAGGLELIDKEKRFVRLGDGVFETGRLERARVDEAVAAIEHYTRLARSLEVDRILAVATSATREAENGDRFLARVKRATGIDPRVISGTEEAKLIFRAVQGAIDLTGRRALVIDIGGGSVELCLGVGEDIEIAESLPLGVRRLRDTVGGPGKIGKKQRKAIEEHIDRVAAELTASVRSAGFDIVIGTSGTLRAIGDLTAKGQKNWKTLNMESAPLDRIDDVVDRLRRATIEERVDDLDVERRRADTIHLGGILLLRLMNALGAEELTFSDASLREGVIREFLAQDAIASARATSGSLRRRTVYELAKKYGAGGPRERHVRTIALELFDRTASIHGYESRARRFLEYAAELHRIGHYVSYRKNHKHARYLVRYAKMAGFTNDEVQLVSLLVRYHRRKEPDVDHKRMKKIAKDDRKMLCLLAGTLRLAIALDRKGSQAVESILCDVSDDRLTVFVSGDDTGLEIERANAEKSVFEEALGRKVEIVGGVTNVTALPSAAAGQ